MKLSSFNLDMDKYLDKRSGMQDVSVAPSRKNPKKKGKLHKFRAAMKAMLDVDQVINVDSMNHHQSTVFEKRTWKDKVIDLLRGSDSVNVDVSKEQSQEEPKITPLKDDLSTEYDISTEEKKAVKKEKHKSHGVFDMFSRSDAKPHFKGDHVPMEQVKQVLQESGVETSQTSLAARDEFRSDLREFIKITYKLIKKLPPETLRIFKESDEFKKYVGILDKYNLLRKRPEE